MLKIAICDAEQSFGERLEKLISSYMNERGEVCIINRFLSGMEFLNQGSNIAAYHIVFLDIHMKQLNGIETAKRIRLFREDTYVIFVASSDNYALDGYKVNAFRYLLKTSEHFNENLYECIDTILYKEKIIPYNMELPFLEGKRKISVGKLIYIESNLHKLTFYVLENGMMRYTLKDNLNHLHEELCSRRFIRIHQSYLVNLSFIKSIDKNTVILEEGTILPIAKARYQQVVNQITTYKKAF